ncbi:MAG: hypothetical protein Q8M53_09340 [Burkholderiales bacterium]|nr:hypothetical protein [Burkholderiales bacterium]
MVMIRYLLLTVLLLIAGCAQLPPLPEDAAAKRFEALPDRAVIYLVRPALDPRFTVPVILNDRMIGSTYHGTFLRIEVPAGRYVLRGMAGDSGAIVVDAAVGRIYYVEHRAYGYRTFTDSSFSAVDPRRGQALVRDGQITALISF